MQVRAAQHTAEQPAAASPAGCTNVEPQTQPPAAEAAFTAGSSQQQPAALDQSQLWRDIAAASFGADGVMDGWDSDTEAPLSSEDKYLKVRQYLKANK